MTQAPAQPQQDEWDKASEGLAGLNEFVGEVKSASFMTATEAFGQASNYEENCVIKLECTVEQAIDPSDFEHEVTNIILSVGKMTNWLILDGGVKIQNAKQGGLGNSKYQMFIKRVNKELNVPIKDRPGSSPFNAQSWVGLRFHFKREGQPNSADFIAKGGPEVSYTMLPIQWMQSEMPPLAVGA